VLLAWPAVIRAIEPAASAPAEKATSFFT
jgi:hypothetical protein